MSTEPTEDSADHTEQTKSKKQLVLELSRHDTPDESEVYGWVDINLSRRILFWIGVVSIIAMMVLCQLWIWVDDLGYDILKTLVSIAIFDLGAAALHGVNLCYRK